MIKKRYRNGEEKRRELAREACRKVRAEGKEEEKMRKYMTAEKLRVKKAGIL